MAIPMPSLINRTQSLVQARALVRPYQTSVPVDVKKIAEQLGLKVWEMKSLPPDISGKLFIDPKNESQFSIGVNSTEGFRRKRFTIAHELAHFLLHRNLITNGVLQDNTLYRSGLSSQEETEANQLAADILMPHHLIRQLMSQGMKSVRELADQFAVSEAAMSIRLGIPIY